jgi:hypothetical protein
MPNRDVWIIVVLTLAVIGAIAVIGFIGMALMSMTTGGMMGGMMNCYGGMAGAWLVGLLLIAVIAAAIILLSRRRPLR